MADSNFESAISISGTNLIYFELNLKNLRFSKLGFNFSV